jgi:hypothetical protein
MASPVEADCKKEEGPLQGMPTKSQLRNKANVGLNRLTAVSNREGFPEVAGGVAF